MKTLNIISFIMIVMVMLSSCSTTELQTGQEIYISLNGLTYRNIVMVDTDSTIKFTNKEQDIAFTGKVTAINTEVVDGELYYRGFYITLK